MTDQRAPVHAMCFTARCHVCQILSCVPAAYLAFRGTNTAFRDRDQRSEENYKDLHTAPKTQSGQG